uniref:UTP25 C-terminal domain-containing protein n=1 Tax=Arcella intermedia TaxID=1963864 RepID=A0A6B2LVN8_9EUKA
MLLVTERFHFFYRYYLKGIKRIVFYGLPSFPEFYPEYLNLLSDSGSCLAMFSSFDLYQLESILGTKRTSSLVNSSKNNHLFY